MSGGITRLRISLRWFYEEYQLHKLLVSLAVVAAIWFVAALVICGAERRYAGLHHTPLDRFGCLRDCLWSSTVYLVSGLEEFEPQAPISKAAAVTVMIAGVGALGMFGARLAATFVEHTQRRGLLRRLPRAEFDSHIVVCGWPEGGARLLAELRATCDKNTTIIVVDERADAIRLPPNHGGWPGVWGLMGDPTDDNTLRRARVDTAHSAIVPPHGAVDSRQQERARELMIVLALRTVAPDLHVTVPATADRTVQRLLERQRVELPLVDGVSSRLVAQASQKHFLTEFYAQLLASNHGTCSVHEAPLPESWAGLDFASLQRLFVEQEHADLTLVGVRHADSDGQMSLLVNPRRGSDRSTPLLAGDRLLVLARSHPDLDAISRDAPRPRAV